MLSLTPFEAHTLIKACEALTLIESEGRFTQEEIALAAHLKARLTPLAGQVTEPDQINARWRIRATDPADTNDEGNPLYWSNSDGWVDRGDADVFVTADHQRVSRPVGGEWERDLIPHGWNSGGSDEPRDQQRDLFGPFWAEVGPEGAGWTWAIMDFDRGNAQMESGFAATEAEAKDAVDVWENTPTDYERASDADIVDEIGGF